jgi:phosphatidylserine decarboxylase
VFTCLSGELEKTIYVPGKLFSVNQITSSYIPNLYSRNERMIAIFKTDAGLMAVILVGAIIVGSIQTVFSPSTNRSKNIITTSYTRSIFLPTGAELGQFKLGSTVIVLFGKDKIKWNASLNSGSSVQFGQLIGMSAHAPRMTTY